VWDWFSHWRGKTFQGHTGDTACDHYHRVSEDVEWMARVGLQAYRFSISWSRVIPAGKGSLNPRGMDFYSRLVDQLLDRGIQPIPTFYHYDLPLPLQTTGGWTNRAVASYFADYAAEVCRRLSDRVDRFITHNEPWVNAVLGYLTGEHAPGRRNPQAAFSSLYHILLSHGMAVQAMRAAAMRPLSIGIALNLSPVYPASASRQDGNAAALTNALMNRVVLDPLLRGFYPEELERLAWWRLLRRSVRPEELAIIQTPLNFIGVNYYTRGVVRWVPLLGSLPVRPRNARYSQMWEIYPQGLTDLLIWLHREYHHPNLLVSENGVPVADVVGADGKIHDMARITYLTEHLRAIQIAISAGVPVSGYLVWSLLDNFEWALGYSRRFGLIHVDFATLKRTPKDSAWWFGEVIRHNRLPD
jgi:beta-glucosidase